MIQGVQLCSSTDVQKVTRPRTSRITKCNVYGCKVKTYVRVCNAIIFITPPPPFKEKTHPKKKAWPSDESNFEDHMQTYRGRIGKEHLHKNYIFLSSNFFPLQ